MIWVICYDITDDKRRRQVVKVMESYGQRVQYSVFECDISERQQMTLQGKLERVMDDDEDNIRFYPLNAADMKLIKRLGKKSRLNVWKDAEII